MLQQGVENIWIFTCFLNCWENQSKSLRDAEKSQGAAEKKLKLTALSSQQSSQSVEMFCLPGKQIFKCWQLLPGAY